MRRHADSHLDHNLTAAQIEYLLDRFADRDAFFIATVELPEDLGTVPCGLYGPTMGDDPVRDDEITFTVRGERKGPSRLIDRLPRPTRQVTVIAGPHDGQPCVLFTAFGGPAAPREPWELESDPAHCRDDFESLDLIASREFWAQHALSKESAE
jgi:hypothetical protein